ncbi:MAG: CRISPR-associated protein Cas2 [Treponemataceae bacterium]|nr:CRISPR-associated protein Cas2 [Treponemataceae bacterium]
MFVSVVVDPGSVESSRAVTSVLMEYGFRKVQRACWEHVTLPEKKLNLLKKDIDRVTDYYDSVRMYQYPVQGLLAVTEMSRKKWKRCFLRPNNEEAESTEE